MTDTSLPGATRRADGAPSRSYVDWPAIFAGAFLASAISMVFTAFGSALGLSLVSPYEGPSPWLFYPLAALWILWITVSGFAAGGYVTGRMRRRIDDATPHEGHIRDGAHGLIVWAVAVVVAALIAASSLGAVIKGTSELAKTGAGKADPVGYAVDAFLRGDGGAAAKNGGASDATRQEVARIIAMSAAKGSFSNDDRAWLSRLVAAHSGLSQADADKRVAVLAGQLKSIADRARKVGVVTAFLTAATLAVGAAAAWWGTSVGGRHRDENVDISHLVRW